MNLSSLVWGSPEWSSVAWLLLGASAIALAWGYWRAGALDHVALLAAALKGLGVLLLAFCLIDPLWSGTRAQRGANLFAVVVDNSQSMTVRASDSAQSRAEIIQEELLAGTNWQTKLDDQFDTRRFLFDSQLRSIDDFSQLSFDGRRSSLSLSLSAIARRFCDLPLAGVLLITDGNATDSEVLPHDDLAPIYPIMIGSNISPADISISRVSVSETNFDAAPVVIRADVSRTGHEGEELLIRLEDERGRIIQSEQVSLSDGDHSSSVEFELRPRRRGVEFYRVSASARGAGLSADVGESTSEDIARREAAINASTEATLANNARLVVVDRAGGPYRVLYVCGRPNWEFKFLRRAIQEDDQLDLVALVRIARREPKFSFRGRAGESTNPLFRGFEHPDEESAEQYDQPVMMRLGTADEEELRDGFPKTAEELYRYDAIILDEVEAAFFSQSQMALVEGFVSRRGGSLLMLGGPDSFAAGKYARTPIGNLLPVYLRNSDGPSESREFRLALTREGWLQPWVRLRKTEPEEQRRLAAMESFRSLSNVQEIKPAASVLAEVTDDTGERRPALVTQRFGNGRSAALLIGDLWRWGMRRKASEESDLEKSWRQTVRWLVSDVPQRIDVDVQSKADSPNGAVAVRVRVRDKTYLPLDNARVEIAVTTPDGKRFSLSAEPHEATPGVYVASFTPRDTGPYRGTVSVAAVDGSMVGQREFGWAAQPAAEEFERLAVNQRMLEEIATQSGGEVVELKDLDRFVSTLATRQAPISEPWTRPFWHQPLFFVGVLLCFSAEWGLRRWRGLA